MKKISREGQILDLEQKHRLCCSHFLRGEVEKMAAVCCKGGGPVLKLHELPSEKEFMWAMGLYRSLLDAAEQYIGCADGEKPGVCAVMCQRCQKENAGHLEPICTGKKTCTRF